VAKLAGFPKCFIEEITNGDMSLSTWIEMASDLPVDGLELYQGFLKSYNSDYLSQIKREINNRGFEMPMMCYSPDFTCPDAADRKREVAKQCDVIKTTAELGGLYCRVLSGQKRPEISVEDGVKWVVESICSCLETAEQYNIVLVMENHYKDPFWAYPEFAQRSDIFNAIIKKITSPYFGVQFDPSNSIVAGEDPLELLEQVKDRVRTMHASDRYLALGATLEELKQSDGTIGYSTSLMHGVIGKGLNDYDAIFRTLRDTGFSGWISIEDGMNGLEEIRESALFLRAKMHEYGLDKN
jgi:sugar phosphate isomerase/epimerase